MNEQKLISMMKELLSNKDLFNIFDQVITISMGIIMDNTSGLFHLTGKEVIEAITGMDHARDNTLINAAENMEIPFVFDGTDCTLKSIRCLDVNIVFIEGFIDIKYESTTMPLNAVTVSDRSDKMFIDPESGRMETNFNRQHIIVVDKNRTKSQTHRVHVIRHELTHIIIDYFERTNGLFKDVEKDQDYYQFMEFFADTFGYMNIYWYLKNNYDINVISDIIQLTVNPLLLPDIKELYGKYLQVLDDNNDEIMQVL